MSLKVKAGNGNQDYTPVPAGNHPAVCVAVIDLGTHSESYMGGEPRDQHKVLIVWEVDAEERMFVGRDYTLSFNEKSNLRQLIEKWRNKTFADDEEFDLAAIVGKPCLLSVSHKQSEKGNTYARVDGAGSLPRGVPPIKPTVPTFTWEITGSEPIPTYDWLPFLRGRPVKLVIEECHELRRTAAPTPTPTKRTVAETVTAEAPAGGEIPF